jgi:hypothetical protein
MATRAIFCAGMASGYLLFFSIESLVGHGGWHARAVLTRSLLATAGSILLIYLVKRFRAERRRAAGQEPGE